MIWFYWITMYDARHLRWSVMFGASTESNTGELRSIEDPTSTLK